MVGWLYVHILVNDLFIGLEIMVLEFEGVVGGLYVHIIVKDLLIKFLMMLFLVTVCCCLPACLSTGIP